MSFLALNEKRAAVGYAPLEEQEPAAAPESDAPVVIGKYRPNQPRAPRGTSDGGQYRVESWMHVVRRETLSSTPGTRRE